MLARAMSTLARGFVLARTKPLLARDPRWRSSAHAGEGGGTLARAKISLARDPRWRGFV